MSIVEDVCKKQGHQLKSFRINDSLVPGKPGLPSSDYLLVARFEIRCAACGQTLEQVTHKKPSGPSGPSGKKKPKIKVGETNEHSGVSAAPQEESNHSNPEPLPSTYSDMP